MKIFWPHQSPVSRRLYAGRAATEESTGSLFFAIPDAFLFWKEGKDKCVQPGLGNLGPPGVGADETIWRLKL